MRRISTCLVLAALAVMAAACQDEGTITVHSLTFKGVQNVTESALKNALATKTNSIIPWGKRAYFDRSRFDTDLKRIQAFYSDRGFPDARVTGFDVHLNDKQDRVDISITIAEGSPILVTALDLVGFDVLDQRALEGLRRRLPLKVGQPRDRQLVLSSHEQALNLLRDRGYPYSVVTVGEDDGSDGKSATLTFSAQPGQLSHFGPVSIVGNERVSDNVIRRGLAFKEGDLYRRSLIQESQRRLYASQLFQFVNVAPLVPAARAVDQTTAINLSAPQPTDQPSAVPTGVTVAEGKPQRVTFGLGYGTEEKARGDVQYQRLNFLGAGRSLTAHGRWSSLDRGIRADFLQPYVFRPDLSFALTGQNWYTYTPAYNSVVSGGKATFTFRRSARRFLAVTFTSENDRSTATSAVLSDPTKRANLIALGIDPETGVQSGALNAIGVDWQQSTADNPINARRGYQVTVHAEKAGGVLPGAFTFWEFTGDGRHYLPISRRLTWANRAQIGKLSPANNDIAKVPFSRKFFLGGSTSVRGWGIYEIGPLSSGLPIGGDSMAAFSSELRAVLVGSLGGVLFLDGGNVWAHPEQIKLNDLRYAVGTGLRYQTPVGPIRFDVGYQLNPIPGLLVDGQPQRRRWRLHFSVGQAF